MGQLKKKQNLQECFLKVFLNFWSRGADFFKFQSQIYSMAVFKNALVTYIFGRV